MADVVVKLYIAGQTPRSLKAVRNLRRIVDSHLGCQAETIIVDIVEHPQVVRSENLLAIPTLVRERPLPTRRVVGDLSDIPMVLEALNIEHDTNQEAV